MDILEAPSPNDLSELLDFALHGLIELRRAADVACGATHLGHDVKRRVMAASVQAVVARRRRLHVGHVVDGRVGAHHTKGGAVVLGAEAEAGVAAVGARVVGAVLVYANLVGHRWCGAGR